jgi:spore maturation protein CgeB
VMEAAACGTPSAALAVGGLPESIDDGRTGLLAHDGADFTRKVATILADGELRESLGRAALERAAGYTWDATARRTLALLQAERARWLEQHDVADLPSPAPRPPAASRPPAVVSPVAARPQPAEEEAPAPPA